jgi:tRNA (guanosine-2'-O-)-methyltransferase
VNGRQLDGTGLKRLHRQWRTKVDRRVALILDGLGTPTNVGSIARTAAAYRVDHVWLAGPTPPFESAGAQRTAMGTDRYLETTTVDTTAAAIAAARADGYRIVGVELAEGAVPLHELELVGDVCLVIGHEDHGIGKAAIESCDAVAFLPQLGKVGSLNVAVATAISIYEVRRRNWTA